MKYEIEFKIDGLPPNITNQRMHWAQKHKLQNVWKVKVYNELHGRLPNKPLQKAKLSFTRGSSAEPDFDNLVASFKMIVDALTFFGVIEDDKPSNIGQSEYQWVKAPIRKGFITVRCEEVC